ncbi:transposase family protein [Streptomyces sp. NPDC096094]|uniref:transposase family protein n=1 Tax=Streptomyces sp. NPDC096094 TaxID=3366073 RepID=UPI00381F8E1F
MPWSGACRGIRHPWAALLTAAACAVLSGAASITAIGEWVADAPQRVLALLGLPPDPLTGLIRPPHATTSASSSTAGHRPARHDDPMWPGPRPTPDLRQERRDAGVASVACSVPRGGTTPVWRPSRRPRSPT